MFLFLFTSLFGESLELFDQQPSGCLRSLKKSSTKVVLNSGIFMHFS